MYKNQLQELAQRSCFNLPSYACIREGPDHAPRFRASVNFHGEIFEGPSYCPTVRQAEHAAAEVALSNLSTRGTSRSLAARVLDETGVYKNLLQETAHRAGLKLPVYTTIRSGPGHQPVFTCSVELAGMSFNGEPAKTKKQAEKNAAMAAWSALKQMPDLGSLQSKETESGDDHEQAAVARVLSNFKPSEENRPVSQRRIMASPHNASGFKNQWRFDDLRSHEPLMYKSQYQERHRAFLTLAPQNGPKILPSSTSKDRNINFVPSQLEAHKEEDDRISEILDGKGKAVSQDIGPRPAYQRIISLPYQRPQQTHRPFGLHFYPVSRNSASASIPRTTGSGGFHSLAPAVHMRSVIPVCAVPPPTRPSPSSSGVEKKEDGGDISTTSLKVKLDKLQL